MPVTKNWAMASVEERWQHIATCDKHINQCADCNSILIYLEDELL